MREHYFINEYLHSLSGSIDSLLDLLSDFCDEFSFQCGKISFTESGVFNPDMLLSKEDNLKAAFIEARLISHKAARFHFKITAQSLKWLKERGESLNLYKPVYEILISDDRENCSNFYFEDLTFYITGQPALFTVTHERVIYVNDIFLPAFYAWAEKEIAPKIEKKKLFIRDWNSKINLLSKDEFIDRFSGDYPLEYFLVILDKNETALNRLTEFFSVSRNVEYFAEIICKKLGKSYSIETAKLLCIWFDSEKCLEAGEKTIREFLSTLKEESFLAFFLSALKYQSRMSLDVRRVKYTGKLFSLWEEKGLDGAKIKVSLFSKIKEIWKDSLALDTRSNTNFRYFQYAKRDALSLLLAEVVNPARVHKEYDYASLKLPFNIRVKKAYDYFYGLLVEQDYNVALPLLKNMAEIGVIDCMFDLARCYEQGLGVEKDLKQAEYWYMKAKENGHPKAQERLEQLARTKNDLEM